MPNLFTADLTAISYQDLELFLGMYSGGIPRAEGSRVEYKRDPTDKIGDGATAFANVAGGIIVVGVTNGTPGTPPQIIGVPKGRQDLGTRLSEIILSSVQPRPRYSLCVLELPHNQLNEVGVIRFEEGPVPPYMWTEGKKNKDQRAPRRS